jgi:hypothetical protein
MSGNIIEEMDLTKIFHEGFLTHLSLHGAGWNSRPTVTIHQAEEPYEQLKSLTGGVQPSRKLVAELAGLAGFLGWSSVRDATLNPGSGYAHLKHLIASCGFRLLPREKTYRRNSTPERGDGIAVINDELANLINFPVAEFCWVSLRLEGNGKVSGSLIAPTSVIPIVWLKRKTGRS